MTAFHSKWMDWKPANLSNQRTYKTNKSPSVGSVGSMSTDSEPKIVCIFCGKTVERGTPGTGALAGADLHTACFLQDKRCSQHETLHRSTTTDAKGVFVDTPK